MSNHFLILRRLAWPSWKASRIVCAAVPRMRWEPADSIVHTLIGGRDEIPEVALEGELENYEDVAAFAGFEPDDEEGLMSLRALGDCYGDESPVRKRIDESLAEAATPGYRASDVPAMRSERPADHDCGKRSWCAWEMTTTMEGWTTRSKQLGAWFQPGA
ncbi:hypothetical protein [Streptomyces sp. NPDC047009]|uniref:hypothetical protein n=1 Tax=Streptomyces sp. NPDC047009 TaxID=3154496 RepID=UPI00340973A1